MTGSVWRRTDRSSVPPQSMAPRIQISEICPSLWMPIISRQVFDAVLGPCTTAASARVSSSAGGDRVRRGCA